MKTFTILAASALVAATATPVASKVAAPVAQTQAALERGAVVRSADGSELGRLEGRRSNDGVPEIVVRGPDGQLRGIPAAAVTVDGAELRANWSTGQFRAAPALVATAVAAPATGAGGNQGADADTDTSGTPMDGPDEEELRDATRPAPVQQDTVNPNPSPQN